MTSWTRLPPGQCIKADLNLASGNVTLDQCKLNCGENCYAICFDGADEEDGGCYGSNAFNMNESYVVGPNLQSFVKSSSSSELIYIQQWTGWQWVTLILVLVLGGIVVLGSKTGFFKIRK